MNLKYSAGALCALLLTACSDNGSNQSTDPTPSSSTLKGRAIDGYIVGATAFLDTNFNGILDNGEPSALTGEDGTFTLNLGAADASCAEYSPLVVDVPVGATDLDLGLITEAYQLTIPPTKAIEHVSQSDLLSVTPLTSVLWNQIQIAMEEYAGEMSCESLVSDFNFRDTLFAEVEDLSFALATHYNVPVAELFSDFIASGNSTLHNDAMQLAKALQASFQDMQVAKRDYPDAELIRIHHLQGEVQDDGTLSDEWIKREFMVFEDQAVWRIEVLDDNFNTVKVREHYIFINKDINGLKHRLEIGFEDKQGESPACAVNEEVLTSSSNPGYGVINNAMWAAVSETDCDGVDFASHITERQVAVESEVGETSTFNQWFYGTSPLPGGLETWINVGDNLDNLDGNALIAALNGYSADFEDNDAMGAESWSRRFSSPETEKVNFDGTRYEERVFNNDGTYSLYCGSTSSDAVLQAPGVVGCPEVE